jgi:hypothetical protein
MTQKFCTPIYSRELQTQNVHAYIRIKLLQTYAGKYVYICVCIHTYVRTYVCTRCLIDAKLTATPSMIAGMRQMNPGSQ